MTLQQWPRQLNYLVEKGFKLTVSEPNLRTDFERGPARERRTSTRQIADLQMSIVMSDLEFEIFKSFWKYKINSGASWFNMKLWTGAEYVDHRARFKAPFDASYYAFKHMMVSAKVETVELETLSEGLGEVLAEYSIPDLIDLGNIVNYTVNEHWETTWP